MVSFQPLARADLPLLADWLARPHVAPWWRHDPAAVDADFGRSIDGPDPAELFLVVHDGTPIGMIQRYQFTDEPEWLASLAVVAAPAEAVGIDYLIGDAELVGRGIGAAMIGEFVADTWRRYPDAPSIIVDVSSENRRSWRVLEKNGFERIWEGVLDDPDAEDDDGPTWIYRLVRPEPPTRNAP